MPQYQVRATNLRGLDDMTRAYLECAEWAGVDSDEQEALESSVSPRWAPESIDRAARDCLEFRQEHTNDILGSHAQAGHDFYLTRNRHGTGFWDGDWPEDVGRRLSHAARVYGEQNVYFEADSETLYLS